MAYRPLVIAFVGLAVACAPPAPRAQTDVRVPRASESASALSTPAAPSTRASSRDPALPDRSWDVVESRRFRFRVPLPDAPNWRVVEDERWFKLVHQPSGSSLSLRTWRASPRIDREDCQKQVYLWNSDLEPEAEAVVERSLVAPEGFEVGLRVDLAYDGGDDRKAIALASGAAVRRCYAAVFETRIAGDAGEAELGNRLRMVTDGVLNRVEIIGIEEVSRQRAF